MSDLLDEIKTRWNFDVTLPMAVPWGSDDVVWLVQEVERLRAENERLRATVKADATLIAHLHIQVAEQGW